MKLKKQFIQATNEYCSFEKHINAPYLRRSFTLNQKPETAVLSICGLGFYVVYVNGKNVTKGPLAPYINAPDDYCYFDQYDIAPHLTEGENVIGVMLGNGMQNAFGGFIWEFEKAPWRGSVKLACTLEINGEELFSADEAFKTHPSPITFDDLRMGCHYDARLEIPCWNLPGFDDSSWKNAEKAITPNGEAKLCGANPLKITQEVKPVAITKCTGGYIYDFGLNSSGVCRLTLNGKPGQKITMTHFEIIRNGEPFNDNINFLRPHSTEYYVNYHQKAVYTCRGGEETFTPEFTYFGFRYVFVEGLEENQATKDLLTYIEFYSDLTKRGSFTCSDETVNKLYQMAHNSDVANFVYFPTDCPQREKNGWTGDASMSAEHMLQWLDCEKSYHVWMENIRARQKANGAIPGIVPTGDWGYEWGNGPAWDSVLVNLPYYTYKYNGTLDLFLENASAILRYLHYATTKMDERGLVNYGLGDWVQPKRPGERFGADSYDAPEEFTDSAMIFDMANKAAFLFEQAGMTAQSHFAAEIAGNMYNSIRTYLIDTDTCVVSSNCQTCQAVSLAFGFFKNEEIPKAKQVLIDLIKKDNDHFFTGMIGIRYIFHVLTALGETELALKMILQDTNPGYGEWVKWGSTNLHEDFLDINDPRLNSLNHHFLGDIANWFVQALAGLRINPEADDITHVDMIPEFLNTLDFASSSFDSKFGKISVGWRRKNGAIVIDIEAPEEIHGDVLLPDGYAFLEGGNSHCLETGTYTVIKEV